METGYFNCESTSFQKLQKVHSNREMVWSWQNVWSNPLNGVSQWDISSIIPRRNKPLNNSTQKASWIRLPTLTQLYPALHKKWSFALGISSVNVTKSQESADLVKFTEEILNGKLNFLCSVNLAVFAFSVQIQCLCSANLAFFVQCHPVIFC